jgi:hypothetical protein
MDDIDAYATQAVRGVVAYTVALLAGAVVYVAAHDRGDALLYVAAFAVVSALAGYWWIRWFRSVYRVVTAARRARFEPHVTWWAWLVPGITLAVPLWLVQDVWRAPAERGTMPPLPAPVRYWWWLWFTSALCGLAGSRMPRGSTLGLVLTFGASALLALSAPFAVRTIRLLTERVAPLHDAAELAGAARSSR